MSLNRIMVVSFLILNSSSYSASPAVDPLSGTSFYIALEHVTAQGTQVCGVTSQGVYLLDKASNVKAKYVSAIKLPVLLFDIEEAAKEVMPTVLGKYTYHSFAKKPDSDESFSLAFSDGKNSAARQGEYSRKLRALLFDVCENVFSN